MTRTVRSKLPDIVTTSCQPANTLAQQCVALINYTKEPPGIVEYIHLKPRPSYTVWRACVPSLQPQE